MLLLAALAVAAVSALVVAPAPSYDPWSWLLWGREITRGTLSTVEGPAFKPLPVAVTTLLAPLGADAAPISWVLLARAAAVVAVGLAFVVGRRLGGTGAGVVAAVGVGLCGAFPRYAASGDVTGLFLALVLAGVLAWWSGRDRLVLACAIGCALLRVEAWPFVLVLGAILWRRGGVPRSVLAAAAVMLPLAWFVPEWLGSGDLLRSSDRARIPNPGQPAEADIPFLASLGDAVTLPLLPFWVGALLVIRRRSDAGLAALAVAGMAWIALVAVMAQVGFSGEARYALPGAALVALAGAVALAGLPRALAAAGILVVAVAAAPRAADLPDLRADQEHQWRLSEDLPEAIALAGGRDAVLRCGTPYVGRYRGPLLAYRLDVHKRAVEPDAPPHAPGTVFRSRHKRTTLAVEPAARHFLAVGRRGPWEVRQDCRQGVSR